MGVGRGKERIGAQSLRLPPPQPCVHKVSCGRRDEMDVLWVGLGRMIGRIVQNRGARGPSDNPCRLRVAESRGSWGWHAAVSVWCFWGLASVLTFTSFSFTEDRLCLFVSSASHPIARVRACVAWLRACTVFGRTDTHRACLLNACRNRTRLKCPLHRPKGRQPVVSSSRCETWRTQRSSWALWCCLQWTRVNQQAGSRMPASIKTCVGGKPLQLFLASWPLVCWP